MNPIIPTSQIPERVSIYGLYDVELRKRLIHFLAGKQQPIDGFYKQDVLAWLRSENTPKLYRICGV